MSVIVNAWTSFLGEVVNHSLGVIEHTVNDWYGADLLSLAVDSVTKRVFVFKQFEQSLTSKVKSYIGTECLFQRINRSLPDGLVLRILQQNSDWLNNNLRREQSCTVNERSAILILTHVEEFGVFLIERNERPDSFVVFVAKTKHLLRSGRDCRDASCSHGHPSQSTHCHLISTSFEVLRSVKKVVLCGSYYLIWEGDE